MLKLSEVLSVIDMLSEAVVLKDSDSVIERVLVVDNDRDKENE